MNHHIREEVKPTVTNIVTVTTDDKFDYEAHYAKLHGNSPRARHLGARLKFIRNFAVRKIRFLATVARDVANRPPSL